MHFLRDFNQPEKIIINIMELITATTDERTWLNYYYDHHLLYGIGLVQ
jgi:hypothetical protein